MFKQFLNQIASKISKPASKKGKVDPKRQLEQAQLNQLRENTISQTAYTPEAEKEIRNMELFQYGTPRASSQANNSGGKAGGMSVGINRNNIQQKRSAYPVTTMRHEALHAMDDNMYGSNAVEGSLADSRNFYKLLEKVSAKQASKIIRTLGNNPTLYNPKNKLSTDMESFAYTGADPKVMLAPSAVSSRYSKVYLPQSKNMNSSPVFPSPETQQWFEKSRNRSTAQRAGRMVLKGTKIK